MEVVGFADRGDEAPRRRRLPRNAYRAKTGKYPAQLSDLKPEFIHEIPQPTVGQKGWQYMLTDQGTNYWLHVVASEFGPSLDKNAGGRWEYMDDRGRRDI